VQIVHCIANSQQFELVEFELDSVSCFTHTRQAAAPLAERISFHGAIAVCRRLDYDSLADHTYNFTVTATDNGLPALTGSANIRVSVTNVNDEDPVFVQSTVEHIQLSEDAQPNTVIHVLQAYDPDGDAVTYSFAGSYIHRAPQLVYSSLQC